MAVNNQKSMLWTYLGVRLNMPVSKKRKSSDKSHIVIPAEYNLDGDAAEAFRLMDSTTETLFLTGRAGTGKSTLLNYFRKNSNKKCVVLAPTGLAALHVGGSTIHSFFGFPLRSMLRNDPDIRSWSKGHPRLKVLEKMDTLIIDEVSMVRADILDAIDQSLRINLRNDIPFGGKQVVLIGDIFQLAPVVSSQDAAYAENEEYETPYFFSARVFKQALPKIIELKTIYRQADEDFIYLLNRIRSGIATPDDISEINKRYSANNQNEDFAIMLSSVNAVADLENQKQLIQLTSDPYSYKATIEGTFNEKLFPAPLVLKLKTGAQVMMVKNDLQGRWVNGSIGRIEDISEEGILVKFQDGQTHKVERVTWENKTYTWDKSANSITFVVHGTFTQYPIRLAWAITIHKSQGLTFDHVIIDMGRGAFAHGQLYVALSRCKTLQGISLKTKVTLKDMIVDEAVENFAGRFRIH